ncbi:MAG TPA: hypothetical protein VLB90_00730 [Pseudomonadales bacterium]|nr:hypothetical protein [Pseudomonadales bacterium]
MKTVKVLAAISLVFAAAQAMAFTPPYHISGTAVTGTATFKSSGGCKVAPTKFTNAQFGSILDSTNASVGTGIMSADGAVVLGVLSSSPAPGIRSQFQDTDPASQRIKLDIMYSMVSGPLVTYLTGESGCNLLSLWPSPTSSVSEDVDFAKGVLTLSVKQAFVGTSGTEPDNCVTKDTKTTCKLDKVSGGFTFKGESAIP